MWSGAGDLTGASIPLPSRNKQHSLKAASVLEVPCRLARKLIALFPPSVVQNCNSSGTTKSSAQWCRRDGWEQALQKDI